MNSTKAAGSAKPRKQEAIAFSLDPGSDVPIYRQIINQIENAILSGRMRQGDRLPTIRALAVGLKTNPNTIARAYGELEIRGILATQVGNGTFISGKKPEEGGGRRQKMEEAARRFVAEMRTLGADRREALELVRGGYDE
jgi:GntR family transcriptional regulator